MEVFKNWLTPAELVNSFGKMSIQGIYKILKTHEIKTEITKNRRKFVPPEGVRKIFEERGFTFPKQNISFQIVKGGVGKTSLSFCLAVRASHYGARVLAIDLDQQGNLTSSLNIDAREKPVWLNLIRDDIPIEKTIIHLTDYLDVIPSSLNNSRLDIELTQSTYNLRDLIKDTLAPIRDNYDLVVIDCPPAINKINTAVTCASDIIIIPVNPDPYAMDGLIYTIAELKRVKKDFKLDFDYRIVWNKYDARERLGAFYMHELTKHIDVPSKIISIVCRVDASMKNAVFNAKSVYELPKKSPIREDTDQLTKEILGINFWQESKS